MKQKWLLTGTALLLAAALAGCGNAPVADQAAKISMEQAQTAALDAANIDAADADISSSTLDEVAGVSCYKVEFTAGGRAYDYSINAETGEVMGPFYEIETSSPAAFLRPGETLCHTQEVFHLQGDEALLEELLRGLIPGGLRAVKEAFNH